MNSAQKNGKATRARFVYAIYSHLNPPQVLRLITTIRALSPHAHIVVHHDPSKSTLNSREVVSAGAIVIPDPIKAHWGDFSQVEQQLHTMRWCLANIDFDWYISVTGQSYPIKALAGLEELLATSKYDAYLAHFSAYDQDVWPSNEAVRRYHYRYIRLPRFPYWHRLPKKLNRLLPPVVASFNRAQPLFKLFPFPRSLPTRFGTLTFQRPFGKKKPLVGANANVTFRRCVLEAALQFVAEHPRYTRYFARTALPDEVFFATIVCNESKFKIANDHLRHIYWPRQDAASVAIMDLSHWVDLERSPAYFALKFDEDTCPQLLDRLDTKLGTT